jgi:L-malate glycosyltransferase
MGGFRVVYEYANRLAVRGHQVTVVHPSRVKYAPQESLTTRQWIRKQFNSMIELYSEPSVDWQHIDNRVKMRFARDTDTRHIPDGDVLFATAWHTVRSVLECPSAKGEKFYLIQGYEVWQSPKDQIDATWQAPLHKVVISKWLLEIAKGLGCRNIAYIPNAIDHQRYRVTKPIEGRRQQVAMLFSLTQIKGSADGIKVLNIAKEKYPDLKAVLFGTPRRQAGIPNWVEYHQNPPQEFIVNQIYNNSSVFLSPSWLEGFALPPAEAAACGCAIAATDSGGIRDFIEDGVTGLLSAPKVPAALADNLCQLLENENLRVQLAKACNSLISRFSWEQNTDKLETLICNVIEERRHGMKMGPAQPYLDAV